MRFVWPPSVWTSGPVRVSQILMVEGRAGGPPRPAGGFAPGGEAAAWGPACSPCRALRRRPGRVLFPPPRAPGRGAPLFRFAFTDAETPPNGAPPGPPQLHRSRVGPPAVGRGTGGTVAPARRPRHRRPVPPGLRPVA